MIELESSESDRSEEELIMDLHAPKGKMIRASHNSSSWWPLSTLKENLCRLNSTPQLVNIRA